MKILITGAGGMLSSDLAERFREKFETIGIGRRSKPDYLLIPYYQCDMEDKASLARLISKEEPDLIFHTAAMTRVDDCETHRAEAVRGNVTITENLIQANQSNNALIIFFSTDYVFDGEKDGEYDEGEAKNPLNVYGETKHFAEEALKENAKRFAIFRTSWLYGKRGKSFPRTIIDLAKKQNVLRVVADQKGRPTYTKDIANAFGHLLEKNPKAISQAEGEVFHLANQGVTTWADFAKAILEEAGYKKVKVESIKSEERQSGAVRPKNSVLSIKKIEQRLGIKLRSWGEAVREFVRGMN